jgi:hypothetical protein
MPQTPVFGLPFEEEGDQPGITLNGGEFGTEVILAEAVETALLGLNASIQTNAADIATLTARVAALEAGTTIPGWTPIQAGSNTGASFSIDLTDGGRFAVGEFELVRLFMRFDLDAEGMVNVRINGDSSAVYRMGRLVYDANGLLDDSGGFSALARWQIGHGATVSTNNLIATFFHMGANNLHNYQATSQRSSDSATTTRRGEFWGSLSSALAATPSSLFVFAADGATSFSNSWWWAEGYRLP